MQQLHCVHEHLRFSWFHCSVRQHTTYENRPYKTLQGFLLLFPFNENLPFSEEKSHRHINVCYECKLWILWYMYIDIVNMSQSRYIHPLKQATICFSHNKSSCEQGIYVGGDWEDRLPTRKMVIMALGLKNRLQDHICFMMIKKIIHVTQTVVWRMMLHSNSSLAGCYNGTW